MSKTAVRMDGMVITYNAGKANEFNALKNIRAEIYPREYIILFGPSGCGKSTLLYTILGGVIPSGGHMFVQEEDIYAYTPAEMNRYQQSTIGIVYQQFNLIASISVLDNVALPMIFLDRAKSDRNQRASMLLRRFGIPERLEDKLPTMMSGGQQQRVAVARALVNDPEILLADEPVGNLDSISAEHVMDSFQEINEKDRKTVILVTHDAKYLPYAHRVFYMRDGELRRVVVNPEKKQVKRVRPGETIVTEIEQLARLYPYAEPIELKVKSVVNFATQSIGFRQLELLEKAVLEVLKGKMDETMFFEHLTKRIADGGVGMHREESVNVAKRVFSLFHNSLDVQRFREQVSHDEMFLHQEKFIDRLLEYLREEIGLHSSGEQIQILRAAVADRIGGIINGEDFAQRLTLPFNLDGAAYDEDTASLIARHLEKLIAQGGYLIQPNELLGAHSENSMRLQDITMLSTRMFKTNPSRTWLTILGMGVGTGAVVALVGLGFGLQSIILERIVFGETLLSLNVASPPSHVVVLDQETIDSFAANEKVKDVSPLANLPALVTYEGLTGNAFLQGMKPSYFLYTGTKAIEGELFTDETAGADRDAVIISGAMLKLFGIENAAEAIGKTLTFRVFVPQEGSDATTEVSLPKEYRIKGVSSDEGTLASVITLDEFNSHFKVPFYERAQVRVIDSESLVPTQDEIIQKGFVVTALSKTVEQANKIFTGIQAVLAVFGGIALTVSAIGMFNTMTVTLLERTAEIGVMRTIGASSRDIVILFVAEAVIVGFLGGIVGIGIGVGIGWGLNGLLGLAASRFGGEAVGLFKYPFLFLVFIATFSGVVGLITGLFPARRAAKINPLDAIRYK